MIRRPKTAGALWASAGLCPGDGRNARPPAFTLIETLVAVGALAFIATGIAVIFEATGKTVTTGKRVSAFNTAAAAIEQRLRSDIASMTRDGFLVIRNEYADPGVPYGSVDPTVVNNNNDVVSLYDGDPKPRLRRTDELMFFAKGHFKSARPPLVPGCEARAEAARVYYGHGQRWRVETVDQKYRRPTLDQYPGNGDTPVTMQLGNADPDNPNRYAADWTLLRHVTLLCPPQAVGRPVPATLPTGLSANNVPDTDLQVALQPAASNIFRGLASLFPTTASGNEVHPAGPSGKPAFGSNLFDIATTDLPEVRSVVLTADVQPGAAGANFYDPTANNAAEGTNVGVDGMFAPGLGNGSVLARQQAWMDDALPAWSDAPTATDRYRVRYEPAPPDFAGVLENTATPVIPAGVQLEVARADQMMLSSANFLPHCTEFIVEWSFGDKYAPAANRPDGTPDPYFRTPAGTYENEVIWHGLLRQSIQASQLHDQAVPFDPDPSRSWNLAWTPYQRNDGSVLSHMVTRDLVHGYQPSGTIDDTKPLTSYFGYVDPTFNPDLSGNGVLGDPTDASVTTIPWKWPTMIRVTLSLADPNDPSYERTFQFVFDVPQDAAR